MAAVTSCENALYIDVIERAFTVRTGKILVEFLFLKVYEARFKNFGNRKWELFGNLYMLLRHRTS